MSIDEILLKPAEWQLDDWLKAKQALYKDFYEIISFSADRADAYEKLKDYFGVKDE